MTRRPYILFLSLVAIGFFAGCGPTYPKCDKDANCHPHEYCVNGMCQQCRSDGDCAVGQTCKQGRCEAPASCTDDSQCPANQSCIDGTCKACTSDDQCGPGGKCNAGRCSRVSATTQVAPQETPQCQLESVYFGFDQSSLSSEAVSTLDQDVQCIKQQTGNHTVTLTGHSDPRGTEEYNLALSDRRAQSVRSRMTALGVNKSKLKVVGRGKLDASGTDEASWAKDRRVDIQ